MTISVFIVLYFTFLKLVLVSKPADRIFSVFVRRS